jgi:hypothetical protein
MKSLQLTAHNSQFTTSYQLTVDNYKLLIESLLKAVNCKLTIAGDCREPA